jgi:hypothetical protein
VLNSLCRRFEAGVAVVVIMRVMSELLDIISYRRSRVTFLEISYVWRGLHTLPGIFCFVRFSVSLRLV